MHIPHVNEAKDHTGKINPVIAVAHALQAIAAFLLGDYEMGDMTQTEPDADGWETLTFKRRKVHK